MPLVFGQSTAPASASMANLATAIVALQTDEKVTSKKVLPQHPHFPAPCFPPPLPPSLLTFLPRPFPISSVPTTDCPLQTPHSSHPSLSPKQKQRAPAKQLPSPQQSLLSAPLLKKLNQVQLHLATKCLANASMGHRTSVDDAYDRAAKMFNQAVFNNAIRVGGARDSQLGPRMLQSGQALRNIMGKLTSSQRRPASSAEPANAAEATPLSADVVDAAATMMLVHPLPACRCWLL